MAEAELERLREEFAKAEDMVLALSAKRKQLQAEVEQLRADLKKCGDDCRAVLKDSLAEVERLRKIEAAARDPFLVLLEARRGVKPHVNEKMSRAAERFRAALRETEAE